MDTLSKTFAENLMYYRTQRGKKQKDLATVLEVSAATVSSWESGAYSPKLSTLCKISAYLDVPVDVLLGLHCDGVECYSREEQELIEAYRTHPEFRSAIRVLLGMDPQKK